MGDFVGGVVGLGVGGGVGGGVGTLVGLAVSIEGGGVAPGFGAGVGGRVGGGVGGGVGAFVGGVVRGGVTPGSEATTGDHTILGLAIGFGVTLTEGTPVFLVDNTSASLQQCRKIPSIVGQHAPASPLELHLGWLEHSAGGSQQSTKHTIKTYIRKICI